MDEKRYSVLAQQRDVEAPQIDAALELVRGFIVERRRVLYGGLAIDCALRLRGRHIYPEGERPDYDFFSPDNVADAYDLADRLAERGFPRVSCIRAIHVQTMRVRVDFVPVADISHVPASVYRALPTLDYAGMLVLHPDYQRMDMHLAFCFPFNGAPREDIFHRYAKDLRRFNLFEEVYPVAPPEAEPPATAQRTLEVPEGCAVHGFHALALLEDALAELRGASSGATVEGRKVTAAVPEGVPSALATPDIEQYARRPGAVQRRPYMDACPYTVELPGDGEGPVVFYSTHWKQLAVFEYRGLLVVSPQYLLLYLMQHYFAGDGADRAHFRASYCRVLTILAEADALLAPRLAKLAPAEADRVLNSTPFGLGPRVLGSESYNEAYLIILAQEAEKAGLAHLPDRFEGFLPDLDELPANYFPGRKRRPAPYDYRSPMFDRDGGVFGAPTENSSEA